MLSQDTIQEKISAKKIAILFENIFSASVASIICATFVFISLLEEKSAHNLAWYIAVIIISTYRFVVGFFYLKRPQYYRIQKYLLIVGALLSAVSWGVISSILMPISVQDQMIIMVIAAGVAAGGIQTLQANLPASLMFIILTLLPESMWSILQPNKDFIVLGLAVMLYMFFLFIIAIRGHKLLHKTLELYFQNIGLIKELKHMNTILQRTNEALQTHEKEMSLINKMNELLQLSHSSKEAYHIIRQSAQELFSDINGALAIYNSSTHQQELVTSWGEPSILKESYPLQMCLAFGDSIPYSVDSPNKEPLCRHYRIPPSGGSICLPLVGTQGVIGMLNFTAKRVISPYEKQLMVTFSEVIKLSLANIELRETLEEQVIRDPLTGLFNRRYLNDTLPRELLNTVREKKSLCVAILDLDHFKYFNDTLGHEAGDEVLKVIGELLQKTFRGNDIACRYGGEEFVVILINANSQNALNRLEDFREKIKNAQIYYKNNFLPQVTISIGIAEAPRQAYQMDEILRLADEALYAAKQAGRDRIILAQRSES